MKLFVQTSIALLAGLVTVTAIPQRRPAGLDVKLTAVGNTKIKAVITNTESTDFRLLTDGTLLDSAPVRKLHVSSSESNGHVAFDGIKKRILLKNLTDGSFTTIGAGKTVEIIEDIASVHNLSTGTYSVHSEGAIPFAKANSNELAGKVTFQSNTLAVKVDGAKAAKVLKAISLLHKRTQLSDCGGNQQQTSINALNLCAALASNAANAARYGDSGKFAEYFGTADGNVRETVANRFGAVGQECSASPNGGVTSTHCVDTYNYCSSNTLAYTVPSQDYIVNCPLYFQVLPLITNSCHGQDQATTTLHETTHAPGVFSPGTDDYAYGYGDNQGLSADLRVLNADTYALYANAIYNSC